MREELMCAGPVQDRGGGGGGSSEGGVGVWFP
jgi:hypothetical protein